MKFAEMQPRMQELKARWEAQAAEDARKPQIDAFAPPTAQTRIPAAQADTNALAAPTPRAELIAWAAEMLRMNPRLFGVMPSEFIGPVGRARLWLLGRPTIELPLPEVC